MTGDPHRETPREKRSSPLSRALRKILGFGAFVSALGLTAVLGAGALNAEGAEGVEDAATAAETVRRAPLVETVLSEARPFPAALKLRGVTEASRKVTVSAQTAGVVISEPRRKGARLAKGDTLCEIEPGDRVARLNEAKARLKEAVAVAKASSELGKKGFSAETTRARDQAALEAARAQVAAMELDMARTRMTAPFDGWLETDTAELGSLLSLGSACATLIALDPIRFVGFAAENEIGKVRLRQPVETRLIDGRRIPAQVSFVARAADARTRTFRVEAQAPNPSTADGMVRDGATATLFIAFGERPAHKAPRAALMLDDEGAIGVMLAEDGRARFQAVELLADEADGVWIAGPPARTEIVTTGQYYVADGAAIRTQRRSAQDDAPDETQPAETAP